MFTERLLLPAEKSDVPYVIHHRWGRPTDNYFYHNENCLLLGVICRYDTPDGKQFLPYTLWAATSIIRSIRPMIGATVAWWLNGSSNRSAW